MEEKLAKFRKRRQQEEQSENKDKSWSPLQWLTSKPQNGEEEHGSAVISESHTQSQELQDPTDPSSHAAYYSPTYLVMGLVCATLWCYIVYILAQYELAGPLILVTVFICLIYFGTSSGRKRKKTELSAYSVFNPNCVRLKGTFTAEQFENELLRRPLDSKTS